jgi:hypothetical protein
MMRTLALLLLAAGVAAALQNDRPEYNRSAASSHDPVKLDSRTYTVETDNDRVRVLRVRLGPDHEVPMHDDRSAILIAVTEVHIRFTRPDRKSLDVHMAAGETRWGYGDTHSIRNLINRSAEFIAIELKR